jgi:ferric-dicitrate binding protein FerR (iron transport regulator)
LKERIQHLLQLYAANQASREEVEELFEWLKKQEGDEALTKFIFDAAHKEVHHPTLPQSDWDSIWRSVESATTKSAHTSAKIVRPIWSRVSRGGIAAAILLLVMAGGAWFFFFRSKPTSPPVVSAVTIKKDIAPGGNKARLTLGDGSIIILDSAGNGKLAEQGKTTIIKSGDGKLVYETKTLTIDPVRSDHPGGHSLTYNTLSTPPGGQFQLILPDGTKVWLNAGSSLRYPASFSTPERRVQLTGEAYFEVKPLPARRPFIVDVNSKGEVQVLGTHFNINAYDDEPSIKTTLLEGKVKVVSRQSAVSGSEGSAILKPGEQVSLSQTSHLSHPIPVQTEGAVAWKNGYFRFKETGIREVMRQVERWYDVEVEYRTDRTDQYYTGVVSRSQNISALLQTLELTGTVHFQIENSTADGKKGKIIVIP